MVKKYTDKERLDALQEMNSKTPFGIICRDSTRGRGWRLHETSMSKASGKNVRDAIDDYLNSKEYGNIF